MKVAVSQLRRIIRNELIKESSRFSRYESTLSPIFANNTELRDEERERAISFAKNYKEDHPGCSLNDMLDTIQFNKSYSVDLQTRNAVVYFFRDAINDDKIDFDKVEF